MTTFNPDDPKWTAYVLNELDETERAAVELELKSSEDARVLVEELRLAVDLTKLDLRQEVPVIPLSEQQRDTIRASAEVVRPRRWFGARPAVLVAGLAAAGVALMVSLVPRPTSQTQPAAAVLRAQTETAAPTDQPKPANEFELRYEHPELAKALNAPAPPPPPAAPGVVLPQGAVAAAPAAVEPAPTALSGGVYGKVKDASSALIPGVTVTATNTETGVSSKAVTGEAGDYKLDGLQPGNYRVTTSLPGFQTSVDNLQIADNSKKERDVTLQVGQASQSVQVQMAAEMSSTTAVGQQPAQGGQQDQKRQQFQQAMAEAARAGAGGRGGAGANSFAPGVAGGLSQSQIGTIADNRVTELSVAPGVPPRYDRIRRPRPNSGEAYDAITDNPFLNVGQNPLSTFSIDVDTASYSNLRRILNQNQLPPRDAVRIEEMINYFSYDYPQPSGNNPVGAAIEAASAPWNPQHRLVRIGIKARDVARGRRPPSNLVFLIDVSGSMEPAERLPLLKDGIRMLVEQLNGNDRVTVVTYAGTTGVALRPTRGDQKDTILSLIQSLQAGGSTNGASGIQLAYEQAQANFISGGVNRVILATDGDFNVGITDRNALLRLIEDKARSGVFLSVLGVGMGNYKDATLEMLADKGNGNYAYLDTLNEARKVLVEEMSSTLVTVAKDVKVQVEFNPAVVDAYRLIGYENRALRNEDFNNDLKDAGDMGAGHAVTVLYEVVPKGVSINAPGVDPLKYQQAKAPSPDARNSNETLTVSIRYKEPTAADSKLLAFPLIDREQTFARASVDFRFAAAVASFGMILRDSPYKGTSNIDSVLSMAEDGLGSDRNGYRREFLQLVQRARQIRGR